MFGTAILIVFTGGAPFEKGAPPDPHPKTFNNMGHGVIVYICAEILYLLIVRYHRGAPPNGTLLPNRRLVYTWSFESYIVCSVDCVITLL